MFINCCNYFSQLHLSYWPRDICWKHISFSKSSQITSLKLKQRNVISTKDLVRKLFIFESFILGSYKGRPSAANSFQFLGHHRHFFVAEEGCLSRGKANGLSAARVFLSLYNHEQCL